MVRVPVRSRLLVLCVVLAGCGGSSHGGASSAVPRFETLTEQGRPAFVTCLSADGRVAGGYGAGPIGWKETGYVGLPYSPNFALERAIAVTADGKRFLCDATRADGSTVPVLAAASGEVVALPLPEGATQGYARALSADGRVALCQDGPGSVGNTPRSYLVRGGVAAYLPLPAGHTGLAVGLSADGTTAVGVAGSRPVRWVGDGAPEALGDVEGGAAAASADGSAIVGTIGNPYSGSHPFRWTVAGGIQPLTLPEGSYNAETSGVSADGKTVLMFAQRPGDGQEADYLWKEGVGTRALLDIVVAAGGTAEEFRGAGGIALSANGRAVAGRGLRQSADAGSQVHAGSWRLILP